MAKPLKRHLALQPISRDHHQSLLLCWKIRKGLEKGIANERIELYVKCVWEEQIKPHFEIEEAYVFPILGKEHKFVCRAVDEHTRLETLFNTEKYSTDSLLTIKDLLEAHIRFEERVLFETVQQVASKEQWETLTSKHAEESCALPWDDEFWL